MAPTLTVNTSASFGSRKPRLFHSYAQLTCVQYGIASRIYRCGCLLYWFKAPWRSTSWFYSAIRMLTARVHSYPLVCPERGPGLDYISMMVNDLKVTLRFLPQHILDSYISPLLAPSTSSGASQHVRITLLKSSSSSPLSFYKPATNYRLNY